MKNSSITIFLPKLISQMAKIPPIVQELLHVKKNIQEHEK